MEEFNQKNINILVEKQRHFFKSGITLPISWRIIQLKKLKNAIYKYRTEIELALNKDLGKSPFESYLCDIGTTISEINECIKNLKKWAKPEKHRSGLLSFPSITTKVYKMPYGVTLIISPYNFPFLLSLSVLSASICGGNTALIKASSKSINCTNVLSKIISETFPEEYIKVIIGNHDVADYCLNARVDKIFYTGSPKVGAHVLECAAKNLTPVALELGGETGNWCIIRKDADLKDAARKIAFIKILNAGQICININQVAVAEEVADTFIKLLIEEYKRQIGENATDNDEYPRLICKKSYDSCKQDCEKYSNRIVYGGTGNPESLKWNPTIIYPVNIEKDDICQRELFNPILPIVPYKDNEVDKLIEIIESREHGLALYVFSKDKNWCKKIMSEMQFGGGCVNEVITHLMVKGVPFNGTGHSGMGAYHGEWGFREFTHPKTVLYGKNHFNLGFREHPYNKKKERILHKLEK